MGKIVALRKNPGRQNKIGKTRRTRADLGGTERRSQRATRRTSPPAAVRYRSQRRITVKLSAISYQPSAISHQPNGPIVQQDQRDPNRSHASALNLWLRAESCELSATNPCKA